MADPQIDRKLNIVFTVTDEKGQDIFVHSTPVRREIYEANFLVLSRMMSAMYEEGIAPFMMPRVGLLMLQDAAAKMNRPNVEQHLLAEIWRLTNVLAPDGSGGWQMLPFEKSISDKLINDDDAQNIRNQLVFFTGASWAHTPSERRDMIYPLFAASGSRITSSTCTDYRSSLPTSTPAVSIGETANPSSIPV
jgi:hypothetical protein